MNRKVDFLLNESIRITNRIANWNALLYIDYGTQNLNKKNTWKTDVYQWLWKENNELFNSACKTFSLCQQCNVLSHWPKFALCDYMVCG